MKHLYALYDKNDNLVSVGFTLKELGVDGLNYTRSRNNKYKGKLYIFQLEPQKDCFYEEDVIFIREFLEECLNKKELAKIFGVSERTIYRRQK